jgi:hypothetical protein
MSRHEPGNVRLCSVNLVLGSNAAGLESTTNLAFCNCFLDLLDFDLAEAFDLEQGAASSSVDRLA